MHQYLNYLDETDSQLLNKLTIDILNYYTNYNLYSKKKWLKKNDFQLSYTKDKKTTKTTKIGFNIIHKHLETYLTFNPEEFRLPMMWCDWMDYSINFNMDFNSVDFKAIGFIEIDLENVFGKKDTNKWTLTEPTIFIPTFFNALSKHIIRKREFLVTNSNKILDQEWILELRSFVSDTISILDITLNRIHYKAEYDKPTSWTFDKCKLGDRNGRLLDKLKWIKKITNSGLPDISREKKSLRRLKELRNHLTHFDPPFIQLKLSEMEIILNDTLEVFKLVYKIRKTIDIEISPFLISLLLQKKVIYKENNDIVMTFNF